MTALGFHARQTAKALPWPSPALSSADRAEGTRPVASEPPAAVALPTSGGWVRLGVIRLRSAYRYLAVWATVLFGVVLLALVAAYVTLTTLGVTASVSQALAIVLDEPLPSSGVLPVLQPEAVLPAAVLVSMVLSGLWFLCALAAVLVHNAVTRLTGGLRVRLRADRTPRVPRPRA